jgi:predicted nucleic acid-binding protein
MVVIKYINKLPGFIDLDTEYAGDKWLISFITRMEVLAFPGISAAEKERALTFLQDVSIIPINEQIEAAAIEVRRKYRPKLPDAVIAATALVLGASLVTGDGPLSKKKIHGLSTIVVSSPSTKASWRSVFVKYRPFCIAIGCLTISTLVFTLLFILK